MTLTNLHLARLLVLLFIQRVLGADLMCRVPIPFFGALEIQSKILLESPTDYLPANSLIYLSCVGDFVVIGSKTSVCTSSGTWSPRLGYCVQLPPSTTTPAPAYNFADFDYAVATNNFDLVRKMLDAGADVNFRLPIAAKKRKARKASSLTDCRRWDILSNGTVLMLAASSASHRSMLSLLIERGADVNAKNRYGWNSLMWSSSNGYVGNMKTLLDNGADINARNRVGNTPLYFAAQNGLLSAVRLLLDRGANIDVKNRKGATALLAAVKNGHAAAVDLLLTRGASLAMANDGWSALMHAANSGFDETMQRLIKHGADVNEKSAIDAFTALMLAAMNGEDVALRLLLRNGADVNARDRTKTNAVTHAARNGWIKSVELLLSFGADINAKDDAGRDTLANTAISYSFYRNKIIQLLLLNGANPSSCPRNLAADCVLNINLTDL